MAEKLRGKGIDAIAFHAGLASAENARPWPASAPGTQW